MACDAPERPVLVIYGGPNGSGKSSAYTDSLTELGGRTLWIVNPDVLTADIVRSEGLLLAAANLAAVGRIERWLDASLDVRRSIGVETVLSTDKYRRIVTKAKALGFEVRLIYVFLRSAEMNIERVRLRVAKGGHHVPEDAIRRRFARSLRTQLPWFLAEADAAILYDNSGAQPRRVATKRDGSLTVYDDVPEILAEALQLPTQ